MTKSDFLLLQDPGEMLEELKRNPTLATDDACWTAMWKRDEEIEKQWQIEHFGHYDSHLLFDPNPSDMSGF